MSDVVNMVYENMLMYAMERIDPAQVNIVLKIMVFKLLRQQPYLGDFR